MIQGRTSAVSTRDRIARRKAGKLRTDPASKASRARQWLERLTTTGVRSASMIRRARVLLELDTTGGEVGTHDEVAVRAGGSRATVRLISKRSSHLASLR